MVILWWAGFETGGGERWGYKRVGFSTMKAEHFAGRKMVEVTTI